MWISSGARGPAQIEASRRLWGVPRFDLLQVHNLLSWEAHLRTLFAMKAAGQLRYVGITTSEGRRHRDFEQIMRKEPLDFIQVTYNVLDREVEERILPLARDRGMAVIINRPFREGELIRKLARHPLPAWAGEIDCANWAQVLLKFIVSHPAVTCAIPATTRVDHVRENMARVLRPPAGRGDAGAHRRPCREALMSEWWTYSLSDFLLFSPRTYYRLFELYNAAIWPAQVVALALGVGRAGAACFARRAWRGWCVAAILAGGWLWVACVLSVAALRDHQLGCELFRLSASRSRRCCCRGPAASATGCAFAGLSDPAGASGFGLAAFALVIYPLIGPLLLGRPWTQAEMFGVAPDPTVLATLGVLVAAERPHWHLLVLPLIWCAISGATLWTMAVAGRAGHAGWPAAIALALTAWKSLARACSRTATLMIVGTGSPDGRQSTPRLSAIPRRSRRRCARSPRASATGW